MHHEFMGAGVKALSLNITLILSHSNSLVISNLRGLRQCLESTSEGRYLSGALDYITSLNLHGNGKGIGRHNTERK